MRKNYPMRKRRCGQGVSILVCLCCLCSQTDSIIVKTRRVIEKGPFEQTMIMQPGRWGDEYRYERVKGIPDRLLNVVVCAWNTDDTQFYAELARAGFLKQLEGVDTSGAVAGHVNQQISYLFATDSAGNLAVMFDNNNNEDFSDDTPFVFTFPHGALVDTMIAHMLEDRLTAADSLLGDSLMSDTVHQEAQAVLDVAFEYRDGRTVKTQKRGVVCMPFAAMLQAAMMKKRESFNFNLGNFDCQIASRRIRGRAYSFCLSMAGSAIRPYNAEEAQLVYDTVPLDTLRHRDNDSVVIHKVGHLLKLGNTLYRFAEVARDGSWFRLERVASTPANTRTFQDTLLSRIQRRPNRTPSVPPVTEEAEPSRPQRGFLPMPFNRKTIDGSEISLESLRKGYALLVFWGTWCAPCRAEVPFLKDLYGAFGPEGDRSLEIVGIARDQAEKVRSFTIDRRMAWPQIAVEERDSLIKGYRVQGYPTLLLLGKDGRMIFSSDQQSMGSENVAMFIAKKMDAVKTFQKFICMGNAEIHGDPKDFCSSALAGEFSAWHLVPLYDFGQGFIRSFDLPKGEYRYVYSCYEPSAEGVRKLLSEKLYRVISVN